MDDVEYSTVVNVIKKYGYCSRIEMKSDTINVAGSMSGYARYNIQGQSWIELDLKFHSPEYLNKFIDDLKTIDKLADEQYICSRNPSVQRAYEDYQILLKLSA